MGFLEEWLRRAGRALSRPPAHAPPGLRLLLRLDAPSLSEDDLEAYDSMAEELGERPPAWPLFGESEDTAERAFYAFSGGGYGPVTMRRAALTRFLSAGGEVRWHFRATAAAKPVGEGDADGAYTWERGVGSKSWSRAAGQRATPAENEGEEVC